MKDELDRNTGESGPLRILVVEDLPSDVILMERELRGLGVPFETRVVQDEEGFRQALSDFGPGLILSDYSMPRFTGLDALRIAQEVVPDIPFIIVTGSTNELTAVECMKAGAWDYCIKEKLYKLAPSIRAALEKRRLMEEKRAALRAVRTSEEQFRTIIENAPIAIVVVQDEKIAYVNKVGVDLSGARELAELLGRSIFDFIHPSCIKMVKERVERLKEGEVPGYTEERFVGVDGRELDVEINSVPMVLNGGTGFMAIFKDVTEQKELLKRYQALVDHTSDAIFLVCDGRFDFVNPRFVEMFGYDLPELRSPGFDLFSIVARDCRERVSDRVERVLSGKTAEDLCEFVGVTKAGERLYCESSLSMLEYKGKRSLLGIIRNRTEQKKAEIEIRKLFMAVEQSPVSIVITDREGDIEYVNPAFARVTGYIPREVIGKNPRILASGLTPRETYRDLWATILAKRVWQGQFINRRKDGSIFYEKAVISPILDQDGNITNFMAIKEDVTEKRELEQRMRQAQKMEAIGTLAGGIAHDFNNILMPVLGYAELCQMMLPEGSEIKAYVGEIEAAARRARDLVQQILTFSRQAPREHLAIDIVPIVKETFKLLRAVVPATISIEQDIRCGLARIMGDPVEIHQVLMNLCVNAQHAMPDGGVMTLGIRLVSFQEERRDCSPVLSPGRYVEISVKDTGCGIDQRDLPKIFEPYFTTKETGKGTGLGLAVVHGIVTNAKGAIRVRSKKGEGSEFYVYFPALEEDARERGGPFCGEDEVPRGRNEKILLVDDEPLIVDLEKETLEQLGYVVDAFTRPEEALKRFKGSPWEYDLVITDMSMPNMPGDLFVRAIRAVRPGMPVIVCTGFSERMDEEKAGEMGVAYLQKPFVPTSLAKAVGRLLKG